MCTYGKLRPTMLVLYNISTVYENEISLARPLKLHQVFILCEICPIQRGLVAVISVHLSIMVLVGFYSDLSWMCKLCTVFFF